MNALMSVEMATSALFAENLTTKALITNGKEKIVSKDYVPNAKKFKKLPKLNIT
jgi:hypothetical protein